MSAALLGAIAVGRATLIEAVRSRLLWVGVFFALVLVVVSVAAASVSFGEQHRLIIDVGLTAASGVGSLMAVSLSIISFAGELDKRTAYPLLARPIPRWAFVLGKYLGITMAMELVVGAMVLATALTVLIYGETVPPALWAAGWLTAVEIAVVVAVSLLFSTLTVPVLAATYTVGVLIVGNLAPDILRLAEKLSGKGELLGSVLYGLYYVPPNLAKLSARSQAANALPVSFDYLVVGGGYGLLYGATALVLAMWIFSARKSL